jgi:hypothetical protein
VKAQPAWLGAASVADIYSLSGCVSEYFCDYVPHSKSPARFASSPSMRFTRRDRACLTLIPARAMKMALWK